MKYWVFLLLLLGAGCKKENGAEDKGAPIRFIKSNGKIYQQFEYNNNGLLAKESWFNTCEQTPMDEFSYIYTGTRLDTIKTVMRSLYSSTTALCDPATGIKSHTLLEYDNSGRLIKETRANGSNSTFYYNAQGFIERVVVNDGGSSNHTHIYKRDSRGNITAHTDAQGNTTQYEYDNKINPYYLVKKHTGVIIAFYNSPNNVVKIKSANGTSVIRYEYNRFGLPAKMFDSNGSTFEFVYE